MDNCRLCRKPLDAGPNEGHRHNVCIDDENRRLKDGKCTFCGDEPIARHNEMLCEYCGENDSVEPQGYPGPQ